MAANLKRMKADITVRGDDIIIEGRETLRGAKCRSFGDHRTAMSMVIAGLAAKGPSSVSDTECVATSFPRFFEALKTLT